MLFDLRGRGRRRVVKVIYLGLAVLMGGGLVFFGVGGNVQGGLFDAFKQGQTDAAKQTQERRDKASKAATTDPRNPALWATLAETEYQLAGQSKGFNSNATTPAEQFTGEARRHLEASKRAWERHLSLAGDKPNTDLAGTMRNALISLGDTEGAVKAQEVILEQRGDSAGFGDYAQLAALAYQAGQTRKGDLASERAVELAPKDQKKDLKASLDAQKAQSTAGAVQGATGAAPAPGS
jgi:hypothetical protein